MTSTDFTSRTPKYSSGKSPALHLERINKNLVSLKSKLNSYICEPKTLLLYQRMQGLRNDLAEMLSNNEDLIWKLKNKILLIEEVKPRVAQQHELYKKLELKILEYIGMARMHC